MAVIDPNMPPKKPEAWMLNQSLRFPFVKPRIPTLDRVAPFFQPAVDAGYYSNFGPVSTAFETDLEAMLPAHKVAVACSNCTVGLSAALLALRIEGQVLIPAFTFQATASAVTGAGLHAIIGDIDPDTGVLAVEAIDGAARQGALGAVIAVRPYGIWSDLTNVPKSVEDCAFLSLSTTLRASAFAPKSSQNMTFQMRSRFFRFTLQSPSASVKVASSRCRERSKSLFALR